MSVTELQFAPATSADDFPLIPLADIVVVERKTTAMSSGGIMLVGKSRDWPCGRVVAVGPGRVYSSFMDASGHHQAGQFIPNTVKVGDFVTFGRFQSGGEPFSIKGRHFVLCRETDIAGISRDGSEIDIKLDVPDQE